MISEKKIILTAAVISLSLCLASCGRGSETEPEKTAEPSETEKTANALDPSLTENTIGAVITLTSGEEITLELYPDVAPKTVANFVKNIQENFYAGTIFHRAEEGFVIQGGGYDADYNLKSVSETVEGEFEENGIENDLSHTRGVISMARPLTSLNGASTQFFIVLEDSEYLDGQYAAFGRVTDGMDVVDEIGSAPLTKDPPSGLQNVPDELFEIESITITSGAEEHSEDEEEPSGSERPSATEETKEEVTL